MTSSTTALPVGLLDLDREQLLTLGSESFKAAVSTRADVLLLENEGEFAVLKDYTDSSKGFAFAIAPWLVYREMRSLRQLENVEGVPRLIGKVTSRAFLMEYLPANRIREAQELLDLPEFVGKTEALVVALHENGVIHGDLRNATNILVDANHDPVFVDFVSAVLRGHRYNPFTWCLYRLCLPIDKGAIIKLKEKYAPELLQPGDVEASRNQGPLERVARWVSVHGRNLVQRVFR